MVPEKKIFQRLSFPTNRQSMKTQTNNTTLSLSQVGEKITQRRTMFVIGHYGIVARRCF
jgi:hypothetical protein